MDQNKRKELRINNNVKLSYSSSARSKAIVWTLLKYIIDENMVNFIQRKQEDQVNKNGSKQKVRAKDKQ
jgi:hypothetical protein